MTGRMLSLMLDKVTHALITELASSAGVSRSAWCRQVLEREAMAELDRQEQAAAVEEAQAQRQERETEATRARQERIDQMHRNQGRGIAAK